MRDIRVDIQVQDLLVLWSHATTTMEKEKSSGQLAGMICGGCLLIGMGVGWAMGNLRAGLFIGLGAGLLAMAFFLMRKRS